MHDSGVRGGILHHALVLAATALRSSEILALRWVDILWLKERIRVSKRWSNSQDGDTKTEASDGFLPLHPVLAHHRSQKARNAGQGEACRFHPLLQAEHPHRYQIRRWSTISGRSERPWRSSAPQGQFLAALGMQTQLVQ
jgi:integrase